MSDDIETWRNARKTTIAKLNELAGALDDIKRRGSKAKIAGASAGIVGAAIAIPSIILIPFTGGASAAVGAIVGAVIGGAGGVTSAGSSIGQWVYGKKIMKEIQAVIDKDREETEHMFAQGGSKIDKYISHVKMACGATKVIASGAKFAVQAALKGADATVEALNTMSKVVKVAGKATVVLSVILVPFDIYDLVSNSIDVHKKTPHEVAEQVREYANTLEKEMEEIAAEVGRSALY